MTPGIRMYCFYDIIQYKYENVVDDLLIYIYYHICISLIYDDTWAPDVLL